MKLGKSLSKSEQRMILGGNQPKGVQCQIEGGCTCPNGDWISPYEYCDSCNTTSTGYDCIRGGVVARQLSCNYYLNQHWCE